MLQHLLCSVNGNLWRSENALKNRWHGYLKKHRVEYLYADPEYVDDQNFPSKCHLDESGACAKVTEHDAVYSSGSSLQIPVAAIEENALHAEVDSAKAMASQQEQYQPLVTLSRKILQQKLEDMILAKKKLIERLHCPPIRHIVKVKKDPHYNSLLIARISDISTEIFQFYKLLA